MTDLNRPPRTLDRESEQRKPCHENLQQRKSSYEDLLAPRPA